MSPCLANLFQTAHDIGREAPFTRRRRIQNQVALFAIQRFKPLIYDGRHRFEMSIRVSLLPEPFISKRHTGKGWHLAALRNLLPSILLERLNVGVVESTRRILASIQVADQAIGLQALDMLINLMKRNFFVCNSAPRSIPAIGNENVNFPVFTEQ